tara:strand:- start:5309 stop:6175 length:867 start_codon:yes stop_codon:yes gene_type:complete
MAIKKVPKSSNIYECKKCNYVTVRKSQYDRHLLTRKHNKQQKAIKKFQCENCNKIYADNSGIWRHKKKCLPKLPVSEQNFILDLQDENSVMKLLEKNSELQSLLALQYDKHHEEMMKLIPQVGNNNNNNHFNLNIFLNEQCKDAINWSEFIKSIEIGMNNMDQVLDSTITKEVMKVICNGIDELGVYKRPIHCLDVKRKKLCIKNVDNWEKDTDKIKTIIESGNRKIQHKYIQSIKKWEEMNPGWENDEELKETWVKIFNICSDEVEENKCVTEISKKSIIPKDIIEE